jgi:hypothetical protein
MATFREASKIKRATHPSYDTQMTEMVQVFKQAHPEMRMALLAATMCGEQLMEATERLKREGLL